MQTSFPLVQAKPNFIHFFLAVGPPLGEDMDTNGGEEVHKDELTDFLSSQYLGSIDTGLPSMDSKDVEDIFKGVLTDESHGSSDNMIFPLSSAPQHRPPSIPAPAATTVHSPTVMIPQNISSIPSTPGILMNH
jgi:hypothetical protein